jgi:hypothetical protein
MEQLVQAVLVVMAAYWPPGQATPADRPAESQ